MLTFKSVTIYKASWPLSWLRLIMYSSNTLLLIAVMSNLNLLPPIVGCLEDWLPCSFDITMVPSESVLLWNWVNILAIALILYLVCSAYPFALRLLKNISSFDNYSSSYLALWLTILPTRVLVLGLKLSWGIPNGCTLWSNSLDIRFLSSLLVLSIFLS